MTRCAWASKASPLEITYHDEEWGVPSYDDRHLFEMLILEGAQAGLSWATILKKREGYRRAFDGFDPEKIARYTPAKRHKLLQDSGIVRNRLKIESAVGNANAYLALRAAGSPGPPSRTPGPPADNGFTLALTAGGFVGLMDAFAAQGTVNVLSSPGSRR